MSSLSPSPWRWAIVAMACAAVMVVFPASGVAQLPSFDEVTSRLTEEIGPILGFAQWIILGIVLVFAFWTSYTAAKGSNDQWLQAILLFIVAGIIAAPGPFFANILGMNELEAALSELHLDTVY